MSKRTTLLFLQLEEWFGRATITRPEGERLLLTNDRSSLLFVAEYIASFGVYAETA
ncbi:MAG: hypothetical protein AAFY29_13065 [Pseudomonadota bacterium]